MLEFNLKTDQKAFEKLANAPSFMFLKRRKYLDLLNAIALKIEGKAKKNARSYGGRTCWGEIADSVSSQVTLRKIVVGASHFAAYHKHDGRKPITAPGKGPNSKRRKFLTIPIDKIVKGRSAGQMSEVMNTWVSKGKSGGLFIFGKKPSAKAKKVFTLFALKKSVQQKSYPWWVEEKEAVKQARLVIRKYFSK